MGILDYIREQALQTPQEWNEGGNIHNWRNHVGDATRDLWDTFTPEQKLAIAEDAEWRASLEDWDE